MRLEGERVDAARKAFHDGLVAEMHAVKDADGQTGHARMRLELGDGNGADKHINVAAIHDRRRRSPPPQP
jgi:hypothetical protein